METSGEEPSVTVPETEGSVSAAEGDSEEAGTELEPQLKQEQASESAVDGEHTCSECGMSFQRRYSLIMHTLKHEKARGYKCSVSMSAFTSVQFSVSLPYF